MSVATPAATYIGDSVAKQFLTRYQADRILAGEACELRRGAYVVLDHLGEGGMGQVFKARHPVMNRLVALKVIRQNRLGDATALPRFLREIRALAQLSHPNIILAHDAVQEADGLLLVMEYAEGVDLARLVRSRGPLPPHMAADYVRQAALGLEHARQRGLVHRDVKPHNLLACDDGKTVKVLDLGLRDSGNPPTSAPTRLDRGRCRYGHSHFMGPSRPSTRER